MDLTTFAGLSAGTTVALEALKNRFPKLVKGREGLLALFIPVAFATASKALHQGYADMSWLNLGVSAALVGLGAQVVHDKVLPVAANLYGAVTGEVRGWLKK